MIVNIWRNSLARVLSYFAKKSLKNSKVKKIGITGSVGKTSTKDAIAAILSVRYRVCKTEGNLNNEIGLPLTILGKTKPESIVGWMNLILDLLFRSVKIDCEYLVLEMAADKGGDIEYLADLAKPDVGVITVIGESHLEFFETKKSLMREKRKLVEGLPKQGWAVLNYDDDMVRSMFNKTRAKVIFYGLNKGAQISAHNITFGNNGTNFKLIYNGNMVPMRLNTFGFGAVKAALAGIAVGLSQNMDLVDIAEGLKNMKTIPGRMNMLEGIKNSVVIDDCYNASPSSAFLAIDSMKNWHHNGRKVVVFGSMWELGTEEKKYHKEVGRRLARFFDTLIFIEKHADWLKEGALSAGKSEKNIYIFTNSLEAKNKIVELIKTNDIILVKGSQANNRLERIVYELLRDKSKAKKVLVRQGSEWQYKI